MTANRRPEAEQFFAPSNPEEAGQFIRRMRDDDAGRIPAAAGRGARNIPGVQAAVDNCTAIDSSAVGLWVQ